MTTSNARPIEGQTVWAPGIVHDRRPSTSQPRWRVRYRDLQLEATVNRAASVRSSRQLGPPRRRTDPRQSAGRVASNLAPIPAQQLERSSLEKRRISNLFASGPQGTFPGRNPGSPLSAVVRPSTRGIGDKAGAAPSPSPARAYLAAEFVVALATTGDARCDRTGRALPEGGDLGCMELTRISAPRSAAPVEQRPPGQLPRRRGCLAFRASTNWMAWNLARVDIEITQDGLRARPPNCGREVAVEPEHHQWLLMGVPLETRFRVGTAMRAQLSCYRVSGSRCTGRHLQGGSLQ